jgi:MOSC domain-containing protein YiiM
MDEKLLGEIKRLFVTTEESREIKESLDIDLDGVYEDKFKGKDLQRSILLVSTKSYELAKQNGIDIADGDLGENILVDFDPYLLESGTKLQVGDVILEI